MCACACVCVCVCAVRPEGESRGVRVRHIQSTFLGHDGCVHRCESTQLS